MCRRNQKWLNVGLRKLKVHGNRVYNEAWNDVFGEAEHKTLDDPESFKIVLTQDCYGNGYFGLGPANRI